MSSDQSEFVDSLMVTTAMWADQVRFGEGLGEDDYEGLCEGVADQVFDRIYDALRDRWPNV